VFFSSNLPAIAVFLSQWERGVNRWIRAETAKNPALTRLRN
jgi:hypothetical protein